MRKAVGIFCIMTALVIASLFLYHYGSIFIDYQKSIDLYDEIRKKNTGTTEKKPDIDAIISGAEHVKDEYTPIDVNSASLLEQNEDYIGWIYIPKTDISYPVVKSSDNEDYLHVDFNKNYSFPGTVFMDCQCKSGILNHHSVLYGHNMNNGTMFAGLKSFQNQEYVDEHPVFWFITPKYKLLYRIFAVCTVSPYDRIQYGIDGVDYKNNEEFMEAMEVIRNHSVVKTDIDSINETDYVMSLSTCTGNDAVRCIVHGVLYKALS